MSLQVQHLTFFGTAIPVAPITHKYLSVWQEVIHQLPEVILQKVWERAIENGFLDGLDLYYCIGGFDPIAFDALFKRVSRTLDQEDEELTLGNPFFIHEVHTRYMYLPYDEEDELLSRRWQQIAEISKQLTPALLDRMIYISNCQNDYLGLQPHEREVRLADFKARHGFEAPEFYRPVRSCGTPLPQVRQVEEVISKELMDGYSNGPFAGCNCSLAHLINKFDKARANGSSFGDLTMGPCEEPTCCVKEVNSSSDQTTGVVVAEEGLGAEREECDAASSSHRTCESDDIQYNHTTQTNATDEHDDSPGKNYYSYQHLFCQHTGGPRNDYYNCFLLGIPTAFHIDQTKNHYFPRPSMAHQNCYGILHRKKLCFENSGFQFHSKSRSLKLTFLHIFLISLKLATAKLVRLKICIFSSEKQDLNYRSFYDCNQKKELIMQSLNLLHQFGGNSVEFVYGQPNRSRRNHKLTPQAFLTQFKADKHALIVQEIPLGRIFRSLDTILSILVTKTTRDQETPILTTQLVFALFYFAPKMLDNEEVEIEFADLANHYPTLYCNAEHFIRLITNRYLPHPEDDAAWVNRHVVHQDSAHTEFIANRPFQPDEARNVLADFYTHGVKMPTEPAGLQIRNHCEAIIAGGVDIPQRPLYDAIGTLEFGPSMVHFLTYLVHKWPYGLPQSRLDVVHALLQRCAGEELFYNRSINGERCMNSLIKCSSLLTYGFSSSVLTPEGEGNGPLHDQEFSVRVTPQTQRQIAGNHFLIVRENVTGASPLFEHFCVKAYKLPFLMGCLSKLHNYLKSTNAFGDSYTAGALLRVFKNAFPMEREMHIEMGTCAALLFNSFMDSQIYRNGNCRHEFILGLARMQTEIDSESLQRIHDSFESILPVVGIYLDRMRQRQFMPASFFATFYVVAKNISILSDQTWQFGRMVVVPHPPGRNIFVMVSRQRNSISMDHALRLLHNFKIAVFRQYVESSRQPRPPRGNSERLEFINTHGNVDYVCSNLVAPEAPTSASRLVEHCFFSVLNILCEDHPPVNVDLIENIWAQDYRHHLHMPDLLVNTFFLIFIEWRVNRPTEQAVRNSLVYQEFDLRFNLQEKTLPVLAPQLVDNRVQDGQAPNLPPNPAGGQGQILGKRNGSASQNFVHAMFQQRNWPNQQAGAQKSTNIGMCSSGSSANLGQESFKNQLIRRTHPSDENNDDVWADSTNSLVTHHFPIKVGVLPAGHNQLDCAH